MSPAQMPEKIAGEFSRCEERGYLTDHEKKLTSDQKTDAAIKETIDRALWSDDVLRAIEAAEIEVFVKDKVVHLGGHIANTTSQRRIQNAIRVIPGLRGIQDNLVMDDKLTHQVAASLGTLEHTYGCKFFTGASHGVISLNGIVNDVHVKLLAEQRVASNSNVRAVINNVDVVGTERGPRDQPFLQPTIGQVIYFLDGVSGVVTQVIINPNNRRVVAMVLQGQFPDQLQDLRSTNNVQAGSPKRFIVVPIDLIRYMTKVSGFLHVNRQEIKRDMNFDPACFSAPAKGWKAPHPYCPADVLFPVEKQKVEYQLLDRGSRSPFVVAWVEQPLSEELLANDSLGG